ncbi:hypothetical protein HanHA300_Chr04g0147691 [Helianthus annuus]|nr:hypothetical protein HanHA300_Chr04g0147691 [Helianthus annuus]KAJ0598007.1 hypothetical protein HanHA89_Chr04g0161041 [Helianthus annuus]KAJ0758638.1 hypothetical protein HanLR1_Chr04g0152631 [Helianthus annuus]KAJ0762308.1 hypothetical protein HanOQP8_Chr04g0159911 [Helianthus annuus]
MFMKGRCELKCRRTIKLNEEPKMINIQASALCIVVILNDEFTRVMLYNFNSVKVFIKLVFFSLYV